MILIYLSNEIMQLLDLLDCIYKRAYVILINGCLLNKNHVHVSIVLRAMLRTLVEDIQRTNTRIAKWLRIDLSYFAHFLNLCVIYLLVT